MNSINRIPRGFAKLIVILSFLGAAMAHPAERIMEIIPLKHQLLENILPVLQPLLEPAVAATTRPIYGSKLSRSLDRGSIIPAQLGNNSYPVTTDFFSL